MCSKSGVLLVAFHHTAGHLYHLLLEDHLVPPTPQQGHGQSAAAAAAHHWSIHFCRCVMRSFQTSEQDTEERNQDDNHHHFLLHCRLVACPDHAIRPLVQPEWVLFRHRIHGVCGAGFRQHRRRSVHLCHRHGHVPVSESQVLPG